MSTSIQANMSDILDLLNRSDFDGFETRLDEDCALDMPGGSRVIGRDSVRDTLSAWLLKGEIRFEDVVFMADASGQRGAAEVTLDIGNGRGDRMTVPAVLLFEQDGGGISRISIYSNAAV